MPAAPDTEPAELLLSQKLWILPLMLLAASCSPEAAAPSQSPPPAGGAGGSAGSVAGGAGGVAGTTTSGGGGSGGSSGSGGSAGSASGAGAGGSAGGGGLGGDGFTDPGTDGDGDFTLSPPYTSSPLNDPGGAPVGQKIMFEMDSSDSAIYPGIDGPYTRRVWVYVPNAYVAGTPAPFIVVQDGNYAVWHGTDVPHPPNFDGPNLPGTANLPLILDNLIGQGMLPPIVVVFAEGGGGDGGGSERGLEYDTVSGKYAEYVETEVLPRAAMEVQTQLAVNLVFTTDPRGRATLGGSSGAAGSFSMAWWHPEYFTRVISFSGTFVRQASPEDPLYPHGCWSYHDYDPYDPAAPNGLIVKEAGMKPLRVWLEVGENDLGADGGPDTYRDFPLANQRMAASFAAKGYHYHFDFAEGAGHLDGGVVAQSLPDALLWLWRGYPLQ